MAQNVTGSGWSSLGVLPFRGYDFRVMKAPTQYVMYFQHHEDTGTYEGPNLPTARAFSPDLKTWTLDPRDVCSTSGDLCKVGPQPGPRMVVLAGTLQLPDGRIRMYHNDGSGHLKSTVSTDGITWTLEAGIRLTQDTASIYERGNFALQLVSFVTLPNGNIRMYYEGGVVAGSPGTPSYYQNYSGPFPFPLFTNGAILSAVSTDGGLTWVRDPGVRINQLVQGPAIRFPGPLPDGTISTTTQYDGGDVTAVAVTENGKTVYRIYAPSYDNGAVSYVSSDGLTFSLEGQIPSVAGDPKAFVMPDGRVWLISNQYPDAFADLLVYGPQTFTVNSVHASIRKVPYNLLPGFNSVVIGVSGSSTSPVTLSAPIGEVQSCPGAAQCTFRPEYYTFSPATGTPPFSSLLTFIGPSNERQKQLIVHASSADSTSVGMVDCMYQPLGNPGVGALCSDTPAALPMTSMRFGFSGGSTTPVTQTSNLMSLGGPGYPFTASSSVPWATVSPATGIAPLPLNVKVDPAGLAPGTYTGTITLSAETTQQTITVTTVVAAGPVINAVQNAATIGAGIASNSFVTISGSGFAPSPTIWSPTTTLPTTLGGVSVTVNGKPGYISYADQAQINVLTPPDKLSGPAAIQVTTAAGTATTNLQAAPVAPAWFTYNLNGTTTLAALFANTATYVAPGGALGPSIPSRPARQDDYLSLYAHGLGATNPVPPVGTVLGTYYPIDDPSRIKVTVAGVPAQVLFAGLVSAGLFQINIQVPRLPYGGDVAVIMTVDGVPTQFGVTLNMFSSVPFPP